MITGIGVALLLPSILQRHRTFDAVQESIQRRSCQKHNKKKKN
jgi:hypothetical protein